MFQEIGFTVGNFECMVPIIIIDMKNLKESYKALNLFWLIFFQYSDQESKSVILLK